MRHHDGIGLLAIAQGRGAAADSAGLRQYTDWSGRRTSRLMTGILRHLRRMSVDPRRTRSLPGGHFQAIRDGALRADDETLDMWAGLAASAVAPGQDGLIDRSLTATLDMMAGHDASLFKYLAQLEETERLSARESDRLALLAEAEIADSAERHPEDDVYRRVIAELEAFRQPYIAALRGTTRYLATSDPARHERSKANLLRLRLIEAKPRSRRSPLEPGAGGPNGALRGRLGSMLARVAALLAGAGADRRPLLRPSHTSGVDGACFRLTPLGRHLADACRTLDRFPGD